MEEFEYLDDMENDELIKIIIEMIDFEETTKALMILEDRDEEKTLELGKEIIEVDRGDDYLQATVWNILFYDNKMKMIEAIDARKAVIGKTLLDEMIMDLNDYEVNISKSLLNKILESYSLISEENRKQMRCDYEKFIGDNFD